MSLLETMINIFYSWSIESASHPVFQINKKSPVHGIKQKHSAIFQTLRFDQSVSCSVSQWKVSDISVLCVPNAGKMKKGFMQILGSGQP